MKSRKPDLFRIHAVFASDALLTILLGFGMATRTIPYVPYGSIHGILAVLLFPLLLLLPLLMSKKPRNVYRALRSRVVLSKKDFAGKRYLAIATKIVTSFMVLTFLLQLVTGSLIATGLGIRLFPGFAMLSFHISFRYGLAALVVCHLSLMLLSNHTRLGRR